MQCKYVEAAGEQEEESQEEVIKRRMFRECVSDKTSSVFQMWGALLFNCKSYITRLLPLKSNFFMLHHYRLRTFALPKNENHLHDSLCMLLLILFR